MMIELTEAIKTFDGPHFKRNIKQAIDNLDPDLLPLQQGLCHSSYVGMTPHRAVILASTEEPDQLKIKCGIFYGGIIAGCQCADDPSPADECQEYCEVMVLIDKASCAAKITLLEE